ncbi:MAG: SusC/RagA family TonB-linked outer membrane protein, partial [Prevotella sp.]|nr:SusC/RagA family TonB-linked outer membrane protein [Prevotella sp.]
MKAVKIRFFCTVMCMFSLFTVAPVNLFATVNEVYQQSITVKGKVTDKAGEPLPGVSIIIKGTTTGVMTDVDGKYSINVPNSNAILTFSYMGFVPQEHKVGNNVTLDVVLVEQSTVLDEVVVVGYGVQKKINLTGSVSSIGSTKIENRAAPNLSTMLTGLASGVSVRQSSGNPGSDGANIRVRGIGTFDGDYRSPLVIVDGAAADMNSLNPEDVESVSVLKDAASAAIYGSRGANGVILVTTKKGRKNVAPKVTYTGILSRTTASRVFDFISDYAEYMELYNMAEFSANPKAISTYDANEIAAWRAAQSDRNGIYTDPDTGNQVPNYLAYPNTNWSDILFAPTYSQKHTLSVSGGSQNSNYLMSLGYFEAPGTLENTGIDQFNARVNVESQITKFLKIGTQTYAMRQRKDPGNLDQVNTYRFQTVGGIVPIHDGKYGGPESPNEKNDVRNPLRDVNAIGGKNTTTRINTT